MAVRKSEEVEKEAVETGASMMALAVRTAPKTRGIDSVKTAVFTGADLEPLARAMEEKAEEK